MRSAKPHEARFASSFRRLARPAVKLAGAGLASAASASLLFVGGAQAAAPPVGLGSAAPFSVLAGSTVTNTGPTTMFGDLGLDPGSSITGAPHALGSTHVDDGVALAAKNSLVTSYTDAAGRPATKLASADLSGQTFTPGVYNASSSLLFSAGNMTLNAQGNPSAVFIFQVGSSLTTGSATHVLLINGAQPCNVFWQIGASATLGTNSVFAGTVMALTTITGQTGMTMDGRLLARNGAVNLDTNTITTSACAAGTSATGTTGTGGTTGTPVGSKNTTAAAKRKAAASKARAKRAARARARRRALALARARARRAAQRAHPRRPRNHRSFTG
jgi:Ice-binding-like